MESVEAVRDALHVLGEQVHVGVERDRRRGVAEVTLHGLYVRALKDQHRRACVSQLRARFPIPIGEPEAGWKGVCSWLKGKSIQHDVADALVPQLELDDDAVEP